MYKVHTSVGEVFYTLSIRPANDFDGQRCFNSTPSTPFEVKYIFIVKYYLILEIKNNIILKSF